MGGTTNRAMSGADVPVGGLRFPLLCGQPSDAGVLTETAWSSRDICGLEAQRSEREPSFILQGLP